MMVDQGAKTRLSESGPDPFLGREFDGYRVDEVIGRGGMGVVYLATQLSLDRPVAIKVLPEELAEHPQFLDRFHREVDVLSKLAHPNIVTVFERGEIDGRQYLVMEYVRGTSLRDVMKKGPLPRDEALAVVRSVLSALEHAHDAGVVHRDIKPENVLVAPGGIVKVADFGLSRLLGPVDVTRLTHTHLLLGTFEYMAPEQRERSKEADARADIFATGVVLYEMLAGELPIGHFEKLSRKRPSECDARIDEIVERSLQKSLDRRYQRASEMGADVSRLLSHAPSEPAPAAAAQQQGRVARARTWLAAQVKEYPLARIDGDLPDRFAARALEHRDVQLWLRRNVPGLWSSFPRGLEFDVDDDRIVMEFDPHVFPEPGVPERLAAAFGRVLERNGPVQAIAASDAEWEASLDDPPAIDALPGDRERPRPRRKHRRRRHSMTQEELDASMSAVTNPWSLGGIGASMVMLVMMAIYGTPEDERFWLTASAGTTAMVFIIAICLYRRRYVLLGLLASGVMAATIYGGYCITADARPAEYAFVVARFDRTEADPSRLRESLHDLLGDTAVQLWVKELCMADWFPEGVRVSAGPSGEVGFYVPMRHTAFESTAREVACAFAHAAEARVPGVRRSITATVGFERKLEELEVPVR